MIGFIQFFEQKSEEIKNLDDTVSKLPEKYKKLITDYEFKYTCKNTLDNDDDHVGYIQGYDIEVSAPWNYGREFTTLHEIGHLVWEKTVTDKQKKMWNILCKKHYSKKPKMNCEEVFCMVFANCYVNHKIETYNIPKLIKFIKNLD